VLACPTCGGRLRLIGTLHDPAVIREILAHVGRSHSGQNPGPAPPEPSAFIAGLIAHLAMNTLRTILMTMLVARRHDEVEKRLGDPRDRILEATRDATFDPGTPWFPSWVPLPLRVIWCAGGLVTLTIRYALRVWWPVLLLAAVLTARYS
jgi:hypothetical protein